MEDRPAPLPHPPPVIPEFAQQISGTRSCCGPTSDNVPDKPFGLSGMTRQEGALSTPNPSPAILHVFSGRGPGRYRSVCLGEDWRDWFAAGVTAGGKSSDSGLDGGEGKYHLPRPVPLWRIRFEGVPSCWAGRACQVHPGMKRRTCRRIAKSSIGAAGGNAPFRSLYSTPGGAPRRPPRRGSFRGVRTFCNRMARASPG